MLKSFSSNKINKFGRILLNTSNNNASKIIRNISITNSNKTDALKEEWKKLATVQLKGKSPDTLVSPTAEGININPIYTANDVKPETHQELPGKYPYTRGPYPTMLAFKPNKKKTIYNIIFILK